MKKRMLITTIVMMLVLAVALTTSSLAWFSARQDSVTATGGQFQATTATGGNVNIAISKSLDGFGTTVAMKQSAAKQMPVCLKSDLEFSGSNSTVSFNETEITNGNFMLEDDRRSETSIVLNDVAADDADADLSTTYYYYDTLYLVNYDEANPLKSLSVALTASVANEAGNIAVPVCMFRLSRRASTAETATNAWTTVDYYVVVLTPNTGDQKYTVYNIMDLTSSSDASALLAANATTSTTKVSAVSGTVDAMTTTMTFNFGETGLAVQAGEYAKLDVLMWYDGAKLNAGSASTLTSFNMTITGANA